LYWIPTALIALVMAAGGLGDALQTESALQVFHHLGYPDYFSTILGVASCSESFALLAPVPRTLREWAYAGLTFDVGGAILSIFAIGDPLSHLAIPLRLGDLQLSYFAWRRRSARWLSGSPMAKMERIAPPTSKVRPAYAHSRSVRGTGASSATTPSSLATPGWSRSSRGSPGGGTPAARTRSAARRPSRRRPSPSDQGGRNPVQEDEDS